MSIGYQANTYSGMGDSSGGVAIGYKANARHNVNEHSAGAVAIGHMANAFTRGVAIGGSFAEFVDGSYASSPNGQDEVTWAFNRGVAVGFNAVGADEGVGVGYRANAQSQSAAIGYRANAGSSFSGVSYGPTFAKGAYSRCLRYGEEWKGADEIPELPSDRSLTGYNKFGYGQVNFHGGTTTNLPTQIFLGGKLGERFVLKDYSALQFTARVIGMNTDTGDTSSWKLSGVIKRRENAITTALVGAVNIDDSHTEGGLTTPPTIDADTTNGALRLKVTGVFANTVQWNAMLIYSETRE